ncbi:MAG TPA: site-specific DNA-methyltransferase [Candidatus Bathyarchaeia archaeon]|nr:site-specific DNA-methyltransferase [Candidatus Bathyarchaeia archaeon]
MGRTFRKKDSARLVWDTKPRRVVNPMDIEFQTAEVVLPNPARNQPSIQSFLNIFSNVELQKNEMNRLIWGDNLLTMQAILSSGYEGKIGLIYIDPPFWTNEDYYARFEVGDTEITKIPSTIERLAYKDIWEGGIDSFLDMLYPRLQLMRRLLASNGSIFLHLDYHIGHYAKLMMDEIFGIQNFRNEIVVKRGRKKGLMYQFEKVDRMHASNDTILWYTKSSDSKFKHPLSQTENVEAKWMGFWSNVDRPTMRYELFEITPDRGQWKWKKERALKAVKNYYKFLSDFDLEIGSEEYQKLTKDQLEFMKNKSLLEYWRSNGQNLEFIRKREEVKYPEYWVEPREHKLIDNLWIDIEAYDYTSKYPTEKHIELLERIIINFSNEGDLIADFFAGSGTTLVVAEKLNRQWIGCDFSKVAIQVVRNRLVQNDSKPFLIENIGNYQRQLVYLAGSRNYEIQSIVLRLYGANPRRDHHGLGIRKIGELIELVYVSYPDRPVTAKKVGELESLAENLDGTGYKQLVILGWDYEYNYDEILHERERASNREWHTKIISKTIPPEVYEYLKKVKTMADLDSFAGKILFYDKPYLRLLKPEIHQTQAEKYQVTVGIERYVVFDFPIENEEHKKGVQELLKDKPLALIDYWAVDWNYDGINFKSSWQAMRRMGRNIQAIPDSTSNELEGGKLYTVAIRVVDIFGNDASNVVNVDLRKDS